MVTNDGTAADAAVASSQLTTDAMILCVDFIAKTPSEKSERKRRASCADATSHCKVCATFALPSARACLNGLSRLWGVLFKVAGRVRVGGDRSSRRE